MAPRLPERKEQDPEERSMTEEKTDALAKPTNAWMQQAQNVTTGTNLNPTDLPSIVGLAQMLQKSPLLPKALMGDLGGTVLVLTQAVQMGISWSVGLKELYVVGNKVNAQARLLRALVERDPNCLQFHVKEATNERCVTLVQRRGMDKPVEVVYTLEDAKKAGLLAKNPNYQSRPREMLIARSSSLAANTYFPSVCLGIDLEEPEAVYGGVAEVVEPPVVLRKRRQAKADPLAAFEPEEPAPRKADAEAQDFVDALDVEVVTEPAEEPVAPPAPAPAPAPEPTRAKPKATAAPAAQAQPGGLLLDLRPPTPPPSEVDPDDAEFVVQYAQKHFGPEEAEKILRGELADCGVSNYGTPAQGLSMLTMDGYTRILTSLRARVRNSEAETDRPGKGRKV